jgi:Zn-dependent peptidase ImmA (M78 family)
MAVERIQSINPERIMWCCADRGITLEELANELNISESTIQRVMNKEDGMTFHQLRRIADYFGRGVLFFLEAGPVDEAQVHTPQFRTLANQKPELSPKLKALIQRAEKQRDIYLSLREDLEDSDWLPFEPPQITGLQPNEAAQAVRTWLGLGDKNKFDSYRAAVEGRGILVFRSNGYSGKWQIPKSDPILGFTIYDPVCPVIFVKKQWESQQSFTLMHELGHLLRHKSSAIDDEHDFVSREGNERDANAFAGHLLVPDLFLRSIQDRDRPTNASQYDNWLEPQRRAWGISGEVILRRLLDAGRLSRPQYQAYRQWREQTRRPETDEGSRQYRHREPRNIFGDTFVRTVLGALHTRNVTLTKASSYLDSLKIQDLHRLERFYAGL